MYYYAIFPNMLLSRPESPADRDHTIRHAVALAIPRDRHAELERRFGFPLVEAWAMTETGSGAVTSTAAGERHVGQRCIGYPHPGMEYRIVGDDGEDVTNGQPGEFLVRSGGSKPRKGFFSHYLKDPGATDEAWAGGWFRSGDVVREGPDGALFFVDRKKNIVRRSGENIAVVEVEGVLRPTDGDGTGSSSAEGG